MLLPSSEDKYLVTARAVNNHGDPIENFSITYRVTITQDSTSASNNDSDSGKQIGLIIL